MNQKRCQEIIRQQCAKEQLRAISLQVNRNGKAIFQYREGTINSQGQPVKADSLFTIGSVSKMVTTLAVLILCDQKKCSLDQPVAELLPTWQMADERYRKITVRMLLNHSAGFYGNTPSGKYTLSANRDYLDQVLAFMKTSELKAEPGKFSVYCNDGFALAEALIEEVSQMSYAEWVEEQILLPLKMNETDFPDHEIRPSRLVLAASPWGDYPQEYVNGIGSGGIYSTAADLCRLMDAISERKLLSEASWEELMRVQFAKPLTVEPKTTLRYGLGWDTAKLDEFACFGLKALAKSGSTYGYNAYVLVCPSEDISAAVLMSAQTGSAPEILKKVMAEILIELGYAKKSAALSTIGALQDKKKIEGTYANNRGRVQIALCGELLTLEENGQVFSLSEANGRFVLPEGFLGKQAPALIFKEEQGRIYAVLEWESAAVSGCFERIPLWEKVEEKATEIRFAAAGKQGILDNEYWDQRQFGTVPLVLSVEQTGDLVWAPYPLRIASPTCARPFLEIPGNNSREMAPMQVEPDGGMRLGQAHYQPLAEIKPMASCRFTIQNQRTVWFWASDALDSIQMSGQGRCVLVSPNGELVFDSALGADLPETMEGLLIGFCGRDGTEIAIEVDQSNKESEGKQ